MNQHRVSPASARNGRGDRFTERPPAAAPACHCGDDFCESVGGDSRQLDSGESTDTLTLYLRALRCTRIFSPEEEFETARQARAGDFAARQLMVEHNLRLVVSIAKAYIGLPALAGAFLLILLGAALFATFSLIVACLVKTRARFMIIRQVLMMHAVYPPAPCRPGCATAHANR